MFRLRGCVVLIALFASTLALAPAAGAQGLLCEGARTGEDVSLSFDGTIGSSMQLLRNGKWLRTVTDDSGATDRSVAGTTYALRVRDRGTSYDVPCTLSGDTPGDDRASCTVEVGETTRLTFSGDLGFSVQLRRGSEWISTVTGLASYDLPDENADGYFIRVRGGRYGGDIQCSDNPTAPQPEPSICSAVRTGTQVALTFDGSVSSSVQLRRDGKWIATVTGQTSFTDTSATGTLYVLRSNNADGTRDDYPCAVTSIDEPANNGAPTCTVNAEGTEIFFAGDLGVDAQLRRFGRWVATVTGQPSTTAQGTDGYVLRVRGGTAPGDVPCGLEQTDIEIIDTLPAPENPIPMTFAANTAGFDGVDLTVTTTGGLYPWDVRVDQAYTTPAMEGLVVSEIVDLVMDPDAVAAFDGADLTLSYDEARITTQESELRIWTYDADLQFWLPAGVSQTVDPDTNTVTATLDHFSIYAILDIAISQIEAGWTRVLGDVPAQCVTEATSNGVDVVFAIDTSGSMDSNDPGDLRVDAAKIFLDEMGDKDRAGVVSFSSSSVQRSALRSLDTISERDAVRAALDATAPAGGGTNISSALNRSTGLLAASPQGRPRITLLLTDGSGTYSRSVAEAAANANVTVYTVGLGAGANQAILTEIADVTGGEYIQLASADQLIPLYQQLGDRIFDDDTDTDADTISDCIELNGAFVPAVVTRAWAQSGYRWEQTTVTGTSVETLPGNPDSDGDGLNDGVELLEADLRDDPVLADVYGYLIDGGITRYYIEVSDPLDPFDPSANVSLTGDGIYLENSELNVDGLNVGQDVLFQPDRYVDRPALESRLVLRGLDVGQIAFNDAITYGDSELCVRNCAEVRALAVANDSDNGRFGPGCSFLGNDLECEERKIISEARSDQNIFGGDDFVNEYFVREQIAIRCAIATRDLDGCAVAAYNIFFEDIEPGEVPALVGLLTENNARPMFTSGLLIAIGSQVGVFPLIRQGDAESFINYRESLAVLFAEFDRLDQGTGTFDGRMTRTELFDVAPGLPFNSSAVLRALAWLKDNPERLEEAHTYGYSGPFVSLSDIRNEMVRTEAFMLDPGLPLEVLRTFPLVDKGEPGPLLEIFSDLGGGYTYEPAVLLLVDTALAEADPNDRVLQNEIISRMPETRGGIRNAMITAMYAEYGLAIQSWVGPVSERGGNWALTAPWASRAVARPVRGDIVGGFLSGAHQCAADGNQWIFYNIGSRYAAFVELIQTTPNPSIAQWETFFERNFSDIGAGQGDAVIRDGFAALIAAREALDLDDAQRLMYQSNGLFATHEQEGVQGHLDCIDSAVPDVVEAWFVTLRIGDTDLKVTSQLQDEFNLDLNDLNAPPQPQNRIWDVPLFDLDPNLGDSSTQFDVSGFDYRIGPGNTGSIDVRPMNGITTLPTTWSVWRDGGVNQGDGNSFYTGTAVGSWDDWQERMWYLINLFRITLTDTSLAEFESEDRLGGEKTSLNAVSVNRLRLTP